MQKNKRSYIKNILAPCLLFSGIAGIITALLIFAFKLAADFAIKLSEDIFTFVRENFEYAPLLLLGATVLGLAVYFILRIAPNCRGGGIPTSVAILRGQINFKWINSVTLLVVSSLISYLGGMPLGNEGPSVQIGTAVGRGTVRCFAKKNSAWDRYIMTGGACAGFAAATGAPLTGILFAFEEAHRRLSPMIFMAAAVSVITGSTVTQILCELTDTQFKIFHFTVDNVLPLKYTWLALIVGLICGAAAILFSKFYANVRKFISNKLSRLPFALQTITVFVAVACIGLTSSHFIGSGHHLTEELLSEEGVWYLLILYFCVRAILMTVANNVGITGGLFVPTLAFGAIIGSLCASLSVSANLMDAQYYTVIVTVGMASFLAASSRIPITAIAFALEALCGLYNVIPIILGVTISYLVIETAGVTAFNDTIVEAKIEEENRGKKPQIIDRAMTAMPDSFVIGKEVRDILWPPTCVILSVEKHGEPHFGIGEGDVLYMHYKTYDPEHTTILLEALLGAQASSRNTPQATADEHQIPDI